MFKTFGFCGSRNLSGFPFIRCGVLAAASQSYGSVLVGCAAGADKAVRLSVPSAKVFSVSHQSRWAYAARSTQLVSSLASSKAPVLVGFPGSSCPVGLVPSSAKLKCFAGFGSGSWASLAFAVDLGVSVRVFLPAGVLSPKRWGSWFLISQGLFAGAWALQSSQQSLFNQT